MFLWRSLLPSVLLSVLTIVTRPERPEVERDRASAAAPTPITRLADRPARTKA